MSSDQLLAQRQDEFRFKNDRIGSVAIIPVHIHRIDMVRRSSRNVNRLATQRIYQSGILPLRVNQDDVVIARQYLIDDFPFRGEAFTGTGYAKDKTVSIQQLLSIGDDHIFADDVLPVINAVW